MISDFENCKIIILGDKSIPNEFLDIDISPPPPLPGYHDFRKGGVKTVLCIVTAVH